MNFFKRLKYVISGIVYQVPTRGKLEFFENFSLMIVSGLDLSDVLDIQIKEASSKGLKRMILKIKTSIDNGDPIWFSLYQAKVLKLNLIAILRLGEEAGRLNENILIVNEYIKKEQKLRSSIRSASLYPAFILVLLLIISLGIGLFVLPNLATTYENLNVDLPFLTRALIKIGEVLESDGYIIVPMILLVLGLFIYIVFLEKSTKFIGEWILFKIPGIKRVLKEVEFSRLGYLAGTLIDAGVPLVMTIDLLTMATPFRSYSRFYKRISYQIENGNSFEQTFSSIPGSKRLLPLYIRQMIISSEKSGKLADSFRKIGQVYTDKSDTTTKDLATIIEPVLLIIIWVGVAIVAFAVIMPIYSLTNSFTSDTSQVSEEGKQEEDGQSVLEYLEISNIESGYLNVYSVIGGDIIDRVDTGDQYAYLEEREGWYKIKIDNEKTGWVNGSYIITINEQ